MTESESAVVYTACELTQLRSGLISGAVPPSEGQVEMNRLMEMMAEAVGRMYESWLAEDEDDYEETE